MFLDVTVPRWFTGQHFLFPEIEFDATALCSVWSSLLCVRSGRQAGLLQKDKGVFLEPAKEPGLSVCAVAVRPLAESLRCLGIWEQALPEGKALLPRLLKAKQ